VLSKKVKQAQEASKRPATEPTTEEHLAALAALEEDYRSLVKANVSEDAALARAQEQARRLHEEISSLEQSNAADEHPVESPPCVIKLSLAFVVY
jgi:VIT1/CCC1 family predicted Fe2+/Mn2+ transporter